MVGAGGRDVYKLPTVLLNLRRLNYGHPFNYGCGCGRVWVGLGFRVRVRVGLCPLSLLFLDLCLRLASGLGLDLVFFLHILLHPFTHLRHCDKEAHHYETISTVSQGSREPFFRPQIDKILSCGAGTTFSQCLRFTRTGYKLSKTQTQHFSGLFSTDCRGGGYLLAWSGLDLGASPRLCSHKVTKNKQATLYFCSYYCLCINNPLILPLLLPSIQTAVPSHLEHSFVSISDGNDAGTAWSGLFQTCRCLSLSQAL